jgi:hypothetical protein
MLDWQILQQVCSGVACRTFAVKQQTQIWLQVRGCRTVSYMQDWASSSASLQWCGVQDVCGEAADTNLAASERVSSCCCRFLCWERKERWKRMVSDGG